MTTRELGSHQLNDAGVRSSEVIPRWRDEESPKAACHRLCAEASSAHASNRVARLSRSLARLVGLSADSRIRSATRVMPRIASRALEYSTRAPVPASVPARNHDSMPTRCVEVTSDQLGLASLDS